MTRLFLDKSLGNVLQSLGDAGIWLVAFVAPLAIPIMLVMLGVMWLRRKREKRVVRDA